MLGFGYFSHRAEEMARDTTAKVVKKEAAEYQETHASAIDVGNFQTEGELNDD